MGNAQGMESGVGHDKSTAGYLISRQVELLEVLGGCEAKNRYHIRNLSSSETQGAMQNSNKLPSRTNSNGKTRPYDYYGMEKSECFERYLCKCNRELSVNISGAGANDEPFVRIHKPFSCVRGMCMNTQTMMKTVPDQKKLAHAYASNICFSCCSVKISGNDGQKPPNAEFVTGSNCLLNANMLCKICGGNFVIPIKRKNGGTVVAEIVHPTLSCMQLCGKQNELWINFKDDQLTETEKNVLVNMLFCTEFEFFNMENN